MHSLRSAAASIAAYALFLLAEEAALMQDTDELSKRPEAVAHGARPCPLQYPARAARPAAEALPYGRHDPRLPSRHRQ
eukprot:3503158-Pleurochrysis_carterae.AAC.2